MGKIENTKNIKIYCGNVDTVDWRIVGVFPYRKEYFSEIVCLQVREGKKVLAESSSEKACWEYIKKSRKQYALRHKVKIKAQVKQLFVQAEDEAFYGNKKLVSNLREQAQGLAQHLDSENQQMGSRKMYRIQESVRFGDRLGISLAFA